MAVDAAFLAKISLFQQLDDDERGVLAQVMVEKTVAERVRAFRRLDVARIDDVRIRSVEQLVLDAVAPHDRKHTYKRA